MSNVYEGDRSHTGFTPIDNAADLMDEVALYVMKEKYVPKKHRYLLGEDLIRKADAIYDNATWANEMHVKHDKDARRRLWRKSMACCRQLDRKLQRLRKVNQEATVESMREILKLLNAEGELRVMEGLDVAQGCVQDGQKHGPLI